MTTTSTAVDHGISITEVHLPAGTSLRASCLCGWQSPIVPSRPQAEAHADVHDSEVAREHARTVRESIETTTEAADATTTRHPLCSATDGFTGVTDDQRWETAYFAGPEVFSSADGHFAIEIGQEELRRADDHSGQHFLPPVVVCWGPSDRVHIPVALARPMAAAIVAAADKIDAPIAQGATR